MSKDRLIVTDFQGDADNDPQHVALRRIEWLTTRSGVDPAAAEAAKEAEMEAPMPGQAVLEAVIAGQRHFTKPQLEFSVSEAIVLTGWELTPVEIMAKGEPWLQSMPVSSNTSRRAVCSNVSCKSSLLPVTDCQKSSASARLINNTSSSGV